MAMLHSEKQKRNIPLLLYPPLVEAIFELRWELQTDNQSGRLQDPSYPMMYGRLYERFKKDFPLIEDLPSVQVHPAAAPYVVRHRMRKEKNGHPLIQIGPGIATVNEAKGYSWHSFQSLILRLVESVAELYPAESSPLNFIRCEMRFLNAIRSDLQKEHPLAFLAEKLYMKVDMDPDLFLLNEMDELPIAVNLNIAYPLRKPRGHLDLSAHLAQADGKPAYIFQTLIQSSGEWVPDSSGVDLWISEAHDAAVNCFLALCKGPLMERFCGL